jgi:hypothetical protein
MDRFGYAPTRNLLPYDGEVFYHGPILNAHEAGSFLHALPWTHELLSVRNLVEELTAISLTPADLVLTSTIEGNQAAGRIPALYGAVVV